MYNNLPSLLLLTSSLTLRGVQGFITPSTTYQHVEQLHMAAPRGFGDSRKQTTKPKTKAKYTAEVIKSDGTIESAKPTEENPFPQAEESSDMSQGARALAEMRRERAEKRNEELRRVRAMQEADALVREQPGAAAIPEKVARRMGARMLPFVGIPLIGGMGAFVGFWYMATYQDMEFQPALVAASTIGLLAFGLVVRLFRASVVVVTAHS